jgi:Asp/Glu/Hydantoin racemase
MIIKACRSAVTDHGADSVILGGAGLAGLARRIGDRVTVPLIDSVEAVVSAAERLGSSPHRKAQAGSFAPTPPDRDGRFGALAGKADGWALSAVATRSRRPHVRSAPGPQVPSPSFCAGLAGMASSGGLGQAPGKQHPRKAVGERSSASPSQVPLLERRRYAIGHDPTNDNVGKVKVS